MYKQFDKSINSNRGGEYVSGDFEFILLIKFVSNTP